MDPQTSLAIHWVFMLSRLHAESMRLRSKMILRTRMELKQDHSYCRDRFALLKQYALENAIEINTQHQEILILQRP